MAALVRFRDNQRYTTRGLSFDAERRRFLIDMEPAETKQITLNFNDILETSETISDVTVSKASGITASVVTTSNITTLSLSDLSRLGDVTLLVTKSGGEIFKVYVRARSTEASYLQDYGWENA